MRRRRIPFGGAKGGVTVDPKHLSKGENERLSRSFFSMIMEIVGPYRDIPAPDVYTDSQRWLVHGRIQPIRKEQLHRSRHRETNHNRRVPRKGCRNGRGVSVTVREAAKQLKMDLKDHLCHPRFRKCRNLHASIPRRDGRQSTSRLRL